MSEYADVMSSVRATQAVAERRGQMIMAQKVFAWMDRHVAEIPDAAFLELLGVVNTCLLTNVQNDA